MIEREAYGLRLRVACYGEADDPECRSGEPHVGFGLFAAPPGGEDRWIPIGHTVTCSVEPEVVALGDLDRIMTGVLKADAYLRFLALRGRPWAEFEGRAREAVEEESAWFVEARESGALLSILTAPLEDLGLTP